MPTELRIENSLASVSTGYTVFEKDQVLTHDQLNSVADYADDQIRLSRVRLGGVGVACGLRVSLSGATVRVTGGVGVTTDGDLLYLDDDTTFNRWRPYDRSFPAYPPLYHGGDVNGAMYNAWELFPAGSRGEPGRPLSELAAELGGGSLSSLFAVLLMESYRQDDDLCSGTDCDNLGARAVNTRKLILVDRGSVPALAGGQATPAQAFAELPALAADRPSLGSAMTTVDQLATAYRGACNAIHDRLTGVLPLIHQHAGAFLEGAVTANSARTWATKLAGYKGAFATATTGIQYYYDFLKDVVEAYNEFREHLFGDDTWCSPPVASFPKHLLLGDLGGSAEKRTGWYPSPVTSRTAGQLEHARFLLQRLDALITRFSVSTSTPIRVTPSAWEDRPLDERAIPFYYTPGGPDPVHTRWSYRLARRGMANMAYGYHAASYAPAGSPAANPLVFQIGRAGFFRVEGILGKAAQTARDELEALIRARNLPFSVRTVLLGTDRAKVVKRPGRRITDLHHVHQVIRKDTDARLADAQEFSEYYSAEVLKATDAGDLFHAQEDEQRTAVRGAVMSLGPVVAASAGTARGRTTGTYSQYRAKASALQTEMTATIHSAAELSFQAKPVAATGFVTPLDTLASGVQTSLLPWLDQVLDWKDQKQDDRLLWKAFAEEHPQAEHFGGVARGGTLVLVHDAGNTVVADVMLPYRWEEEPVDEDEPALTAPPPDRPKIKRPPVRRVPSRKLGFEREWLVKEPQINVLTDARKDLDAWMVSQAGLLQQQMGQGMLLLTQEKLNIQTETMSTVGKAYESMIGTAFNYRQTAGAPGDFTMQYEDQTLGMMTDATRKQTETVNQLRDLAETDEAMRPQLDAAQETLSGMLEQTAGYMATRGTKVGAGTEGTRAMKELGSGMAALTGSAAQGRAKAGMQNVAKNVADAGLKSAFNNMLRGG